jgi:hypothetical protein
MSKIQCYDFGKLFSEQSITRRDIDVSAAGSNVVLRERVNLCRSCDKARSKTAFWWWVIVLGVIIGWAMLSG